MLQTRQVQSTTQPESYEILQGKKLININIVESVTEATEDQEVIKNYTYDQIVTTIDADNEQIISQHEYEWAKSRLDESDIEIAYHERQSKRATATIEEWFEYQESLRDYASKEDGVYSTSGERPIKPSSSI